jgi:uncharacterized protein
MNIESPSNPPVTVDVLQKVKPGCEAEFELVLADLIVAAKAFEGHLGANVFRPVDRANPEYRVVFKFDQLSHLQQWERSQIRRKLLERVGGLTIGESKWQTITGLETWFTIVPPPRYKMVLITCLAAFPSGNAVNFLFQFLPAQPPLLSSSLQTLVLLSLMTYVIMPRVTRLFSGWLYPKSTL